MERTRGFVEARRSSATETARISSSVHRYDFNRQVAPPLHVNCAYAAALCRSAAMPEIARSAAIASRTLASFSISESRQKFLSSTGCCSVSGAEAACAMRSEEHTSELQSPMYL